MSNKMTNEIIKTEGEKARFLVTDVSDAYFPFGMSTNNIEQKPDFRNYLARANKTQFGDNAKPVVIIRDFNLKDYMSFTATEIVTHLCKKTESGDEFSRILEDTERERTGLKCTRLDACLKYALNSKSLDIPLDTRFLKGFRDGLKNTFPIRLAHNSYFQSGRLIVPMGFVYAPNRQTIITDVEGADFDTSLHDQFMLENLIQLSLGESRFNNNVGRDGEDTTEDFKNRFLHFINVRSPEEFLGAPADKYSFLTDAIDYFGGFKECQDALRNYNETFYPTQIKKAADSYELARKFLKSLVDSGDD